MWLFPSRAQWKNWSLPSRLTAIGAYAGIFGIFLAFLLFGLSLYLENRKLANPSILSLPRSRVIRVTQTKRYDPRLVEGVAEEILAISPPSTEPEEIKHDLAALVKDSPSVLESGYDFRLIECLRNENTVSCYLAVQNTEADSWLGRDLVLSSGAAVDNHGIDHEAVALQLGSLESTPDSISVSRQMPEGAFIKAEVQFDDVAKSATRRAIPKRWYTVYPRP